MKNLIFMLCAMAVSVAWAGPDGGGRVKVLSTQNDIFYFKVPVDFIGGAIEIVAWDGEVVGSAVIVRKRNLVDFISLDPGEYTVSISKDDETEEFHYHKE